MHHLYDCRCNLADVLYFDRFRKIKLDIVVDCCTMGCRLNDEGKIMLDLFIPQLFFDFWELFLALEIFCGCVIIDIHTENWIW